MSGLTTGALTRLLAARRGFRGVMPARVPAAAADVMGATLATEAALGEGRMEALWEGAPRRLGQAAGLAARTNHDDGLAAFLAERRPRWRRVTPGTPRLLKLVQHGVLYLLSRGAPVPDALGAVLRAVGAMEQERERALEAMARWETFREACHHTMLMVGSGWCLPGAQAWLDWLLLPRSGGQRFARLLLNLTGGDEVAMRRLDTLELALFNRCLPSLPEMLGSLLLRSDLVTDPAQQCPGQTPGEPAAAAEEACDEGAPEVPDDVKNVPLRLALLAWLVLGSSERAEHLAGWLEEATAALTGPAQRAGGAGELVPVKRLAHDPNTSCYRALLQGDTAADDLRRVYVTDLVMERKEGAHGGDRGPWAPLVGPPPWARASAALVYALDAGAENFAARVMPSVELWPSFARRMKAWHTAVARFVPLTPADAAFDRGPWRLTRGGGSDQRWSLSRLFLELVQHLLFGDRASLAALPLDPTERAQRAFDALDEPARLQWLATFDLAAAAAWSGLDTDALPADPQRRDRWLRQQCGRHRLHPLDVFWGGALRHRLHLEAEEVHRAPNRLARIIARERPLWQACRRAALETVMPAEPLASGPW